MSLLDDALKKRQEEMQKTEIPSHLLGLQEEKGLEKTQPKKLFLTLLALLVLFSGGLSFAILKYNNSQIRPKLHSLTSHDEVAGDSSTNIQTMASQQTGTQKTVEKTAGNKQKADTSQTIITEKLTKVVHNGHKTSKTEKSDKSDAIKNTVILHTDNKHQAKSHIGTKDKVLARVSSDSSKNTKPLSISKVKKRSRVDTFFVTAARYQRDGRIKEAIKIYKQILSIYPDNRKARLNLGAAYLQIGQLTPAAAILERLFQQYPNDPRVLLNYSIVLTKFGRYQKALNLLSMADKKGGPRFEILLNKGIVLRKMGKLGEAIRVYEEANKIKPDDPRLIFNEAIVYDASGSYQMAISYYQAYLDNPEHDRKKDTKIRERLQQLYAYLNHLRQQKYTKN